MRQLDAEPTRRAENRLAVANVDLAVVDGESLASRLGGGFASHVRSAGRWRFMRNMHAALVLDRAAGCALLIVPVTGRFLFVAIAHRVQNLAYQCPSGLVSSSGKYFNTHSKGFGRPDQGRDYHLRIFWSLVQQRSNPGHEHRPLGYKEAIAKCDDFSVLHTCPSYAHVFRRVIRVGKIFYQGLSRRLWIKPAGAPMAGLLD